MEGDGLVTGASKNGKLATWKIVVIGISGAIAAIIIIALGASLGSCKKSLAGTTGSDIALDASCAIALGGGTVGAEGDVMFITPPSACSAQLLTYVSGTSFSCTIILPILPGAGGRAPSA